ncbi:MAG: 2-oxoacid:ferredoxin oxidoreductase subunit beta [Planctomycetota bacterium]|nr:MAG: 2-oxoacid:ferredoxin oxidoreductase subunit beta [Planctomycetota bacterium]
MSSTAATPPDALKAKDFKSDQDVRWCPGCGDYGILNSVQKAFASLGLDRDKTVFVSGIGCSSRFPYYMDTYGMHSIHGRAPAIASGVKLANPELEVWVVTGDGDGLSIGGNHLIHALRRHVNLKILMFNNRIYGLTKGQFSPTSELGKVTKSSPVGSVDTPFNPISLAIGAGASFVARSVDVMGGHLREVIRQAHEHQGTSFIEIFQNCNIFNDGAWMQLTAKEVRDDLLIDVRHAEPLKFGKDFQKGLIWDKNRLRVVRLGEEDEGLGRPAEEKDLVVWDAHDPNPTLAFAASQLMETVDPTAIGVLRNLQGVQSYEKLVHQQIASEREKRGDKSLMDLIYSGNTWEI